MLVQKLRLKNGWSQEQLAIISGLSVRTIQRIERGQVPALESLNALAASFGIDVEQLQNQDAKDTNMKARIFSSEESQEALAFEKVRKTKGLYVHIIQYVVVIPILFAINLITAPDYIWAIWPAIGWGSGIALHALMISDLIPFFTADWEKRKVEKILGRKL